MWAAMAGRQGGAPLVCDCRVVRRFARTGHLITPQRMQRVSPGRINCLVVSLPVVLPLSLLGCLVGSGPGRSQKMSRLKLSSEIVSVMCVLPL